MQNLGKTWSVILLFCLEGKRSCQFCYQAAVHSTHRVYFLTRKGFFKTKNWNAVSEVKSRVAGKGCFPLSSSLPFPFLYCLSCPSCCFSSWGAKVWRFHLFSSQWRSYFIWEGRGDSEHINDRKIKKISSPHWHTSHFSVKNPEGGQGKKHAAAWLVWVCL